MRIGVIMDPIQGIKTSKDSTFAMMLAAQHRDWSLYYMELGDLSVRDGRGFARMRQVSVRDDGNDWFSLGAVANQPLAELDVLLMRKDPPFDTEYVFATYILELAVAEGVLVVNDPRGLRDVSEKMFISWFPQCIAPTLISRNHNQIKEFFAEHGDIVVKPLDGMGGVSVFRITAQDSNINVIIETVTRLEQRFIMAQKFIPDIARGDKRVLMIDGQPVPYALARIPQGNDLRGNLAAGGSGEGVELTSRDRWICEQVGPVLKKKGLLFVGLDIIGDFLTEINVTSPTCIRELDRIFSLDIAADLMEVIARIREHAS